MRFSVVQARSRKVEAQSKLEQLQRDIAELSSLSPDTVASEEEVTHKLQQVGPMIGSPHTFQRAMSALEFGSAACACRRCWQET